MQDVSGEAAKRFWDARAEEEPLFFVDNRLSYDDPDEQAFWDGGPEALDGLLDAVGATIGPEDRVVDIGCGVGRLTRVISGRARDVRAIDVSPRMLEHARSHNAHLPNVTWIEGDGVSLAGIETASADACVSHVVFQHIPDPEITLGYVREIGRVLRPGGWAAFQVSDDPHVHRLRPRLRDRLLALVGRAPKGQAHPYWHGSDVDLAALRATADAAGMDVAAVVGEGTQFCLLRTVKRG